MNIIFIGFFKIMNYISFINDNEKTFSTYNGHKSIFENKNVDYVIGLLNELEDEKIISKINMGNSKENRLW